MINGKPSSPMDHMGIRKLKGYKIDRMLKLKDNRKIIDVAPHSGGVVFAAASKLQNRRVKRKN